jgi:hypothetical protein
VIGLACVNYAAYYTEADVDALENGPKFFLIYTIGCYANAFDNRDPGGNYVGDAISEHFINNPNGGAFAFIGNSRYGWYSPGHPGEGPSNRYDIEFFDAIYVEGIRHIGAALQDSKEDLAGLAGNEIMKWVYYTLNLLGDPETELVLLPPPEHEISVQDMEAPDWLQPLETSMINATICDYGLNNETNVSVDFMVDGVVVDNQTIPFLANGTSVQVSFNWAAPTLERAYNITIYAEPVPGENITINNARTKTIQVVEIAGHIKAVVLDSYGTDFNISTWEKLNSKWYQYGDTLIHIDYTTLNINDITYSDIAATNADVLVISCAYMWEFTDSEIDAITHYVLEGHGLIATAGTFYLGVPNNNKLAQLFGLSDAITWDATGTDSLDILELTHPLFANIPNPYTMPYRGTAIPSDWAWDSNELVDGTYVALGDSLESAIVVRNGLVFISPWVENTPTNDDLQLLYNAITWSRYEIPEHEVHVKTDKDWYSSNEPIIITTNVTRRETPVTGANVTAFITVPEDVLIGTLTLHDDGTHGDIVQDDGIYTNTFPGIRSGNSTGTYKVTVRATILDYDVEEGEADFIFIGDNNLLVRVLNTLNEPAPYVYLNVLDQSTGSIVRWWYLADENGIYCTTLPEGLYAVMAWSGRDYRYRTGRTDNFFLIDEDLDVSNNMVVVVLLNATAGVPVLLQTSNINEEPEGYFYVDLYPAVGGFGLEVAYTNSSGEAVIYTTPSLYHIAVRKYATPSYYLYKLNVDCTNPRTVAFQPAVTTTSNLTLSLQRVARDQYGWGWIHPTSLPSPFGFGFGDEVIVTPDEWEVWGGNTYIMPQNGYWYYDLWCEPARIFNITIPRSSATFHFGGTLQFTLSAGESYDPGDVVPIYWNLTDSFGNIVEGIYESTEHISEPTFVTNTGLRKTQILNATGIPQPIAYREHRPYLIIIDPEDSPLVNTDVYWWEKPKQYELSADAINGVYTAEMSVYTGPWQNTIAVSDIFTVGNASPSIGWISAWVYPDNYWLVTGGDVARGKTLRIYSGVSDAETPSQDLTVSISYRPQGGEWTTTQASYNPTWDYWYIDWTIPGGATLGLYDVKVDASDPNGGSVSSTVLSQFKVV